VPSAHVLIVEDEPDIAELIRFHCEREGLETRMAPNGKLGIEFAKRDPPDLIILDLMLPDVGGLEICRRLTAANETRGIPIMMVTAKGEEADVVAGLEVGADDYVVKPFSPRVLMARIRAVLRRAAELQSTPVDNRLVRVSERLVIDPDRHIVTCDGAATDLTVTEFGILNHLAQRPGFVRTRDQIISAVHGRNVRLSSRTIDVHVTALRKKLGELAGCVETVRGVGYRFNDAPEPTEA
jgi:two-component system alkaline phosphatase synthesis response regulator PhoP